MSKKLIILNDVTQMQLSGSLFFREDLEKEVEESVYELKINDEKKKKGRKKKSKVYFPKETEDYIEQYNNEDNPSIRNKIYNDHLKYAFDKLAENMINSFKFPYIDGNYKDIKSEVIAHMLMNIDKYQKGKGKAFSYFSIVAKNYLIIRNNESYKEAKMIQSIHGPSDTDQEQYEFDIMDEDYDKGIENEEKYEFIQLMVDYWEENITRVFKKKRDIDIAYSILELFKNVKSLEFFNKKALYLLIRNMTDYKTQYITKVLNKMGDHYPTIKEMYYHKGIIDNGKKFF